MTQDEAWNKHYRDYAAFVGQNSRCPSKHHEEERQLHSWWKQTRKQLNAGTLRPDRAARFKELITLAESNRHVNQYK